MKTTTLSCLLAALSSAAVVLAGGIQVATAREYALHATAAPTVIPLPDVLENEEGKLELREIVVAAPTQAPMQVPSVTVQMLETSLKGATAHTWLPVTYTQKFSATPDPWPLPASGAIGLGTLSKTKKDKRDAEPTPAPIDGPAPTIFIPFELVVRSLKVEQQVFLVQEMEVIQPVTITHLVYGNFTGQSSSAVSATLSNSRPGASISRQLSTYGALASGIGSTSTASSETLSSLVTGSSVGSTVFSTSGVATSSAGVLFDSPHTEWATYAPAQGTAGQQM